MKILITGCAVALTCAASLPAFAETASLTTRAIATPQLLPACGDDGGGVDPQLKTAARTRTVAAMGGISANGAALVIGTDAASVKSNFASVIEGNFNRSPETLISRLSDKEITAIFRHYGETKTLSGSPLMKTLASRLSDNALVRLSRSVDPQTVREAVNTYASTDIKQSFATQTAIAPSTLTVAPAAAPTIDMTLEEIYLEFRTAPLGSVGPTAAIAETSMYAGANLGVAWGTGTLVGTQISNIITEYDPSLSDAIGGTVAGMVDASRAAASSLEEGHFQTAYDQLFDYPVTDSGAGAADYDVAEPMEEWYGSGGGCGW